MKKGKMLCVLAMSAILLTGCVDSMPELTKEQSGMIAEYAASMLLKYSPNYNYRIVSEDEVAAARYERELEESQTQEETEDAEQSVETEEQQPSEETKVVTDETESSDEVADVLPTDTDLAAELGIEGVTIRYRSYELCDSYPQDNTGFGVSAAQGKTLLIIHFDLQGSTQEDVQCDLFDCGLTVRANVNGTVKRALSTMLLNEMMSYMDTIPEGETEDVVAAVELDEMSEDEIESFVLEISSDNGSCSIQVQ